MKIQIEAELSNYIESLHYDRNSIQELLLMAAKQGLKDTDAYNAWMKDYLGKSKEYEIAKATLEREFIIPAVGNAAVDWVLDFSTATVRFCSPVGRCCADCRASFRLRVASTVLPSELTMPSWRP